MSALSLRAAGRLALAVLLIGTGGLGIWSLAPGPSMWSGRELPASAGQPRVSRRIIVYRLDKRSPTTFRFTQPVRQTRLIMQPLLSPRSVSQGKKWVYAVRAELLDQSGQVVDTRFIHSQTVLFEASGKRRGAIRYFRNSRDLVAPADEVRIAADRPFATMRLVSAVTPAGMIAIDVRVSEQRPLIDSAAASAFQRLSPGDRRRLAAPNAFPADLLTVQERSAIAVNQWRPVGPAGIDGRDYRMAVLYEQQDSDSAPDIVDAEGGG